MQISSGTCTAPTRQASALPIPAALSPAPSDSYTPTSPAADLDPRQFRNALGGFPTGAVVVTTGQGEERHGMTASSFHSVSLDPPLVSYCAANQSGTLAAIEKNGTFAVNVLASDQADVCWRFARPGDRFAGQSFQPGPATGAPLLEGAVTRFECKLVQEIPAGDHKIVLGQVVRMDPQTGRSPLLFWNGKICAAPGPDSGRS